MVLLCFRGGKTGVFRVGNRRIDAMFAHGLILQGRVGVIFPPRLRAIVADRGVGIRFIWIINWVG